QAKAEGYRSRAAYKLIELDDRFGLLKGTKRVVDLGIAPGGWSQVVRKRAPAAGVVGIDLLETEPLEGVTILQMDFMADEAPQALEAALDGAPDLVLSDMAANTVGHKQTDHLRTMGLVEAAAHFAVEVLSEGGAFVAKVLAGGTDADLLALLKKHFRTVKHANPPASRKGSSEWYVVARGFKGRDYPAPIRCLVVARLSCRGRILFRLLLGDGARGGLPSFFRGAGGSGLGAFVTFGSRFLGRRLGQRRAATVLHHVQDHVGPLFRVTEAGEAHLRARDHPLRAAQPLVHDFVGPFTPE